MNNLVPQENRLSFTLAKWNLKEVIQKSVDPKINQIRIQHSFKIEETFIFYFSSIFRHNNAPFDRIISLSLKGVLFPQYKKAKFPKLLKYLVLLQNLEIGGKNVWASSCIGFLTAFYIAIKYKGFERKDKVKFTCLGLRERVIEHEDRYHYVVASMMTMFSKVFTYCTSGKNVNLYRYHFILCEKVSRKRKNFEYLIGPIYLDAPKDYKIFNRAYGGYLNAFAWKS